MGAQISVLLLRSPRIAPIVAAWLLCLTAGGSAETTDVSQLFGGRVTAITGAASPLLRGDFDGDGKPDYAFLVNVAPSKEQKSVSAGVVVIDKLFGGRGLATPTTVHGLAIALSGGAKKFLIVDVQSPASGGFFEAPLWSPPAAGWDKTHEAPLRSKKRGSRELKGFPCLGNAKGDVLLLGTESGVDIALAWTGATFKKCENPNDEP